MAKAPETRNDDTNVAEGQFFFFFLVGVGVLFSYER